MARPDSLNPTKARKAARDPARPGEDCASAPDRYDIIVDRGKCEGKGDCVEVCPYSVFEVGRLTDAEFSALSLLGKVKSLAHRRKTARTPKLHACQACGMCIVACPEDALTLRLR